MKRERDLKRTYSMRFRFLTTLIVAIVAITLFVGGLSLYEVDRYIQEQAEDYVGVACTNEAEKINGNLRNMEKSVKIMESYLMSFFTSGADITDRALQERAVENADRMFLDVVKHATTSGAISYYFRLDPAISDGTTGLFYSKMNGSGDFVAFAPTDITAYDRNDTEHVGWFWQPYDAGKAIWMDPYHNQNNGALMISYVVPMYLDGRFIGVVGMDFDYKVLSDSVHAVEVYENGFAHLETDTGILCDEEHASDAESDESASKYLRISEKLVNGMTLVLSASYEDIKQIRYDITVTILVATIILSTLFTVVAIYIVKRIVDPLKKITEASVKLSGGDYNIEPVQSSTTEIRLLSTSFEDMAKRLREREEHLHRSAHRDSLTGLRNTTSYAAWIAKFEKQIEGKQVAFGVAVLDINDLKKTNDRYGHGVGNALIVTAAKLIADTFKRSPVFRIGGDEFLVLLQNHDLEHREELFAQFFAESASTFVNDDAGVPVRIAVGFAEYDPDKDQRFEDVFRRADAAMYEDKRKSKAESV